MPLLGRHVVLVQGEPESLELDATHASFVDLVALHSATVRFAQVRVQRRMVLLVDALFADTLLHLLELVILVHQQRQEAGALNLGLDLLVPVFERCWARLRVPAAVMVRVRVRVRPLLRIVVRVEV